LQTSRAEAAKIFELWMACHTQDEIAEAVGITQKQISDITDGFIPSVLENQTSKTAANHGTDFTPPIYNVWKQQTKTLNLQPSFAA
jgi:predicted XRE-type DNA-binding protein